MLFEGNLKDLPAIQYASWEISNMPHQIIHCNIERIEPGKKPIHLVGFWVYGGDENRFILCIPSPGGNYLLEVKEPPQWAFAEIDGT